MTRSRRLLAMLALAVTMLVPSGAAAAADEGVELRATIDGHDVAASSANRPILLQDETPAVMRIRITNRSADEVLVRSVRLQGRVIGLTMFAYEARVDRRVAPGATDEVTFEIELVDLSRQAIGLIPARIELLDADRHVVATQRFASDVDGSPRSVYGLFGLIVAAITVVLFVSALVRLAAHALPANRWKRGVRFGIVGLGAGLTATFTLSAFGILFPTPGLWSSLLAVGGVGMFVAGYVSPSPDDLPPEPDAEVEPVAFASTAGDARSTIPVGAP